MVPDIVYPQGTCEEGSFTVIETVFFALELHVVKADKDWCGPRFRIFAHNGTVVGLRVSKTSCLILYFCQLFILLQLLSSFLYTLVRCLFFVFPTFLSLSQFKACLIKVLKNVFV